MNITFNIERLVPRFLLTDKNGYALCKAIERAFQLVAEGAQRGLDIIQDPYKMPEWRLDELAQELGCLYDYNGSMAQKRYWIINATYLYTVYGTPRAINNFLEGYFQIVDVEEFWQYGGDPFHFRVTVSGDSYDADKIAWAQKAIQEVKNVRSVLDGVTIDNSSEIIVSGDTEYFYLSFMRAAEDEYAGDNDTTPAILIQPHDITASAGETITLTLSAAGAYRYDWEWNDPADPLRWRNTSHHHKSTPSFSFTVRETQNGYKYRCIVYTSSGTITSKTITTTVT